MEDKFKDMFGALGDELQGIRRGRKYFYSDVGRDIGIELRTADRERDHANVRAAQRGNVRAEQ
ncbi:MAG: hypothetical protein KGL35_29015 [Bradyrhizobium sp.]|nr:hypothetical protein [Bradyrhizobium sp.]